MRADSSPFHLWFFKFKLFIKFHLVLETYVVCHVPTNYAVHHSRAPSALVRLFTRWSDWLISPRHSASNRCIPTAVHPFGIGDFHFGIGPFHLTCQLYSKLFLSHKNISFYAINTNPPPPPQSCIQVQYINTVEAERECSAPLCNITKICPAIC